MKKCCLTFLVIMISTLLFGCPTSNTKRVDQDDRSDIEVGTGLTSQDFRSIAQRMARSLITLPQIQNTNTPPKVAFIDVANHSLEYIDGDMFLRKMRTELVKHSNGKITFLDRDVVGHIERENRDKERGKRTIGKETVPLGADFFLTGEIESIDKSTQEGRTTYTRYSFRLTDAASSAIIWEDDYEIKKHAHTGIIYQ